MDTDADINASPGTIIAETDSLGVVCGDHRILHILSLQATGKRRMDTDAYLRGARLSNPHIV